jgi:hypothetical protein
MRVCAPRPRPFPASGLYRRRLGMKTGL